jgi:hypothetical protein
LAVLDLEKLLILLNNETVAVRPHADGAGVVVGEGEVVGVGNALKIYF